MPPKKGDKHPHDKHPEPKHPAKKAAAKKHVNDKPDGEKAAKHKHPRKKHGHTKDLRRAFEHMSRVQSLHGSLDRTQSKSVDTLVSLAHQELTGGEEQNAADLLRAAEHLSFAFLADDDASSGRLSSQLLEAIHEQHERLTGKAQEHWDEQGDHHGELAKIYDAATKAAAKALKDKHYHRALEYQRAAEALAHVELQPTRKLDSGKPQRQLKAS